MGPVSLVFFEGSFPGFFSGSLKGDPWGSLRGVIWGSLGEGCWVSFLGSLESSRNGFISFLFVNINTLCMSAQ